MYPQSNQTKLQQLMTKKWFVIGAPLAVIVLIIIGLLMLVPGSILQRSFPKYNLAKTNLNYQSNYGYLSGSDLFSYNGLSFYKINLETGKKSVLNTGQRLPKPQSIHWAGENGALMTFSSSYSMSAVEDALRAKGKQLDIETRDYTWYLDFATGSLKLVDIEPPLANQVYYSNSENGFYYVPDQSTYPEPVAPLKFYDIAKGKSEEIESDLGLIDLGAIGRCSDSVRICVVMRDKDDMASEKIYGLTKDTNKKLLFDSGGQIFPTNDPHRFMVVERETDTPSTSVDTTLNTAEHVDEIDNADAPAKLKDMATSKMYDLGFTVGLTEPKIHFTDDKTFYVIDNTLGERGADNEQALTYRSGELSGDSASSAVYPLSLGGKTFNSQLVDYVSHGDGSNMLLSTVDGDQIVMSGESDVQGLNVKNVSAIQKAIDQCTGPSLAKESQYLEASKLYRAFFVDNSSFAANIKRFATCIERSDVSPLHGYTFQLSGIDAASGRLTTD